MTAFVGLYLLLLAFLVLACMAWQAYRGTHPIISTRNFFLLGFVIFQLISGTISLSFDLYDDLRPNDPGTTGMIYAAMATAFLLVFMYAYSRGWIVRGIPGRIDPVFPVPEPTTMLGASIGFLVVGTLCRLVIMRIPLIGVLADIVGYSMLGVAAGLAMYVWAPRLMNPFVGILASFVIFTALLVVLNRTFGRRDIISVLVAVLWAAYHGHWKFQGGRFTVIRLAGIAAAGLFLVAAFTATRVAQDRRLSTGEFLQSFNLSTLSHGFLQLGTGQFAAANSMWLIENHPAAVPYDPFHTLIYAVVQPVPRQLWEDKPRGLGFTMVRDAGVQFKAAEFNFGPGIIGHIANDNPWLTLVPYAIILALALRLLDECCTRHGTNPFVIIPVGVALGEVTGLSRGETGLFFFRAVVAVTSAWVLMRLGGRLMRSMGFPGMTSFADGAPQGEDADLADGHGELDDQQPDLFDVQAAYAYAEDSRS